MNPSVLTFSCQQCFSVRWNKLPGSFIFYNQLCTAEYTHSPESCLCQHQFCVEQEVFVSATFLMFYTGVGFIIFISPFSPVHSSPTDKLLYYQFSTREAFRWLHYVQNVLNVGYLYSNGCHYHWCYQCFCKVMFISLSWFKKAFNQSKSRSKYLIFRSVKCIAVGSLWDIVEI